MINLQIRSEYQGLIDQDLLLKVGHSAVLTCGLEPEGVLTIVIDDDVLIRDLNHRYRGIDKSTDVLSFPAGDIDPETNQPYYGDIIISYPNARQQSQDAKHSVETELAILTVHGILHLAGYDHGNEQEKTRMWEIQGRILNDNGIIYKNIYD